MYNTTDFNSEKTSISLITFVLMLSVVMLPLVEGGFDHIIVYWVILLLLIASVDLVFTKELDIKLRADFPFSWYLLFLLWSGLSIFWSLNPHRTLVEFLEISCYGLVFFLTMQINKDNLYRLGRIAWIGGIGAALFGMSQYVFLSTGRTSGTFTNANPFGIFLVMIFSLGFGYFLNSSHFVKDLGSIVLLIALFLSGSRGSIIAFIISLPILLFLNTKVSFYKKVMKTVLIIGIALISVQGLMLLAPIIQDSLGTHHTLIPFISRSHSFIASSGVGRLAFWEVGGRLALNEPLKGYGLGTFFLAYPLEYLGDRWYARFVHNHFIQTMAEIGFIGFSFFAAFFVALGRKMINFIQSKEYPTIFPGMVAAITAFFIHIGVDFSWNFPGVAVIFFATAGGLNGLIKEERIQKGFYLNSKVLIITYLLLFLLTAWQLSVNLLYRQGIQHEGGGDIRGAVTVYDRANRIYPINSMSYYFASRGYQKMALEESDPYLMENALHLAQRAVRFSPVDSMLHNYLGNLYFEINNTEKAEKHLSLAVDYASYRIGMYLDLGWFYIQQDRIENAVEILLQSLELEDVVISRFGREQNLEGQLHTIFLLLARIYNDTGSEDERDYYLDKAREIERMIEERNK